MLMDFVLTRLYIRLYNSINYIIVKRYKDLIIIKLQMKAVFNFTQGQSIIESANPSQTVGGSTTSKVSNYHQTSEDNTYSAYFNNRSIQKSTGENVLFISCFLENHLTFDIVFFKKDDEWTSNKKVVGYDSNGSAVDIDVFFSKNETNDILLNFVW